MEVSEYHPERHSLLDAIHRFNTATAIMDETIMVPNMLKDITPGEEGNEDRVNAKDVIENRNLYDSYSLLKSLRHDMTWGVHPKNQTVEKHSQDKEDHQEEETGDLVDQFQHHLRGLLTVLTKLTKKANLLTNCYKKEVENGNSPYSKSIYY